MTVLPGKFDVTPEGSASFSIPISIPPGTAGMVPFLSINYMSGGGNGPLGMGWSLGGLSAITRCPQTVAQDGASVPVSYTATDRFCIDGQRLVVTNGGTYGAAGSIYHTEIESFSKITVPAVVLDGNGPANFSVQTKAGQTMEYGNSGVSPNSAVVLPTASSAVATWLLDKVTDAAGNYMTVQYNTYTAYGDTEVLPSEIDYTGNTAAGLNPYNKVTFVYEGRPDTPTHFTAGSLVTSMHLLTDIETWSGTTEVYDYKLGYQTSPSTGWSLLNSVQLCDAAGDNCSTATPVQSCVGTSTPCLPTRTFSYDTDGVLPNANATATGGSLAAPAGTNFAGLNGSYSGYQISEGNFTGSGEDSVLLVSVSPNSHSGTGVLANGTGVQLLLNNAGHFASVAATETLPTATSATALAQSIAGDVPVIGDFNGDGRDDIFWWSAAAYYGNLGTTPPGSITSSLWLSNGDGTFNVVPNPFYIPSSAYVYLDKAIAGDFNGDGRADLFFYFNGGGLGNDVGHWGLVSSNGTGNGEQTNMALVYSDCVSVTNCGFSVPQIQTWAGPVLFPIEGYQPYVEDMNGDGKSDIVFVPEGDNSGRAVATIPGFSINAGTTATIWYSPIAFNPNTNNQTDGFASGAVTSAISNFSVSSVQNYRPVFGDFNGDGLPDIFWDLEDLYDRSTGALPVLWQNEGNATFNVIALPSSLTATNPVTSYRPIAGDFNGAGVDDILWDKENTDGGTEGSRMLWASTGNGFSTTAYGATNNVAGMSGPASANLIDTTGNNSATAFHPILGDFVGDGKASILWDDSNAYGVSQGTRQLWTSDGGQNDLVTSFANGLGAVTNVAYLTLEQGFTSSLPTATVFSGFYGGWNSPVCSYFPASYPIVNITAAIPVVIATQSSSGDTANDSYSTYYAYACAHADASGRGLLGFGQQIVSDPQTHIVQTTNFWQNFPQTGLVASQTKTYTGSVSNVTLDTTSNTYIELTPTSPVALPSTWNGSTSAETAPQLPVLASSQVQSKDLPTTANPSGATMPTVTTNYSYDTYGEATTVAVSKSDGSSQTTTNVYGADNTSGSNWLLNRLTQSTVTSTSP